MNIDTIREYCLSLPLTTEDMAFGDECLLFRVFNKIFLSCSLDSNLIIALKSDPERAIELREQYSAIEPAWHWNKKYWIQLHCDCGLSGEFIKTLIRASYREVVIKLPKKIKTEYPEINAVL